MKEISVMKEKKKQPLKTSKPLKRVPWKESIGYLVGKAMGEPPEPNPKNKY